MPSLKESAKEKRRLEIDKASDLMAWQKEWIMLSIPHLLPIKGIFALRNQKNQEIGLEVHYVENDEIQVKTGFLQ